MLAAQLLREDALNRGEVPPDVAPRLRGQPCAQAAGEVGVAMRARAAGHQGLGEFALGAAEHSAYGPGLGRVAPAPGRGRTERVLPSHDVVERFVARPALDGAGATQQAGASIRRTW